MIRAMTEQNLKNAFSGESQAHMRYKIFANIAAAEGFRNVARLFEATSYAEQVHSTNHFNNLAHLSGGFITIGMAGFGPGSTSKNLQIAIDGEAYEINEMYPAYIEVARFQKELDAEKSFNWAYQTEQVHLAMFKKAKDIVDRGRDIESKKIQVCSVCGYTLEGDAPDRCPICNVGKDKFKTF
jgi:rubrerythrin